MAETRGTLFWNIARILEDERRGPSVVLLENVRNLAGPRHTRDASRRSSRTLRQLGYRTASRPRSSRRTCCRASWAAVHRCASASSSWPTTSAARPREDPANFDDPIVTPKTFESEWRKDDVGPRARPAAAARTTRSTAKLRPGVGRAEVDRHLGPAAHRGGRAARARRAAARLPDLGRRVPTARRGRGHHRGRRACAASRCPTWKRDFLLKNARFYERHADGPRRASSSSWTPFPPSRRKFEWQAGPHRPLSETVMHFRPRHPVPSGPTTCRRSSPSPRRPSSATGAG